MSEAILCLGSTIGCDAKYNIMCSFSQLRQMGGCQLVERTPVYPSASGYFNCVARITTDLAYGQLVALTKEVERLLGREPEHKDRGVVVIDIDVVTFDGEVKREQDYRSQYFIDGMHLLAHPRPQSDFDDAFPLY